eukprot:gene25957-31170_t
MRAIVLDAPGPPEALTIKVIPIPVPIAGWVLAVGEVVNCPGGELTEGRQVAAMMGGMGRTFDGGYAEYTCVPVSQVVPFSSELDWSTVGAVPEMLQTSYGSLTVGLDAKSGQSLLIRGGTSSVGMATAVL